MKLLVALTTISAVSAGALGCRSAAGTPELDLWCQQAACAPVYRLSGMCLDDGPLPTTSAPVPTTAGPSTTPEVLQPGSWCQSVRPGVSHSWCAANGCPEGDEHVEGPCEIIGTPPSTEAPFTTLEPPVVIEEDLDNVPAGFLCKSIATHITHQYCEDTRCEVGNGDLCDWVGTERFTTGAPFVAASTDAPTEQGTVAPDAVCGAVIGSGVSHLYCQQVGCAEHFVSEGICEWVNGATAPPTVIYTTTEQPTTTPQGPCTTECCSAVPYATHAWCNYDIQCAPFYVASGICFYADGRTTEAPATTEEPAPTTPFSQGTPAPDATCVAAQPFISHEFCADQCVPGSVMVATGVCACVGPCPTFAPYTTTTEAVETTLSPQ